MYNRDYEEYMKSVLGYNPTNEIYNNTYNSNYDRYQVDYNSLYPDIYNKLEPVISRVCSMNTKPINDVTINEMVDAIIANVNLDEYMEVVKEEPKLRNGDVRNPNARDTMDGRQKRPSKLLKELLRILILNKLLNISKNGRNYVQNNRMPNIGDVYSNGLGNKYSIF